jgi:hypothetical protein
VINDMGGWKTTRSSGAAMEMEKRGWRILTEDGKNFEVRNPEGVVMCEDLGTALEAQRFGDACLRRESK